MKFNNKPSKETSDELQKHNEAKQYDQNKIDKELDEISKKMKHTREDTTNIYLK